MDRYIWSRLKPLQVGRYAEYFAKMEFTIHGFDVYSSEVDDHGIDFVIRKDPTAYYDVQVKSIRVPSLATSYYVFFAKSKFQPRENLLGTIVLFFEGREPELYMIPSMEWLNRARPIWGGLLKSFEHSKGKTEPEWAVNVSKKTHPLLQKVYRFDRAVEQFLGGDHNAEESGALKNDGQVTGCRCVRCRAGFGVALPPEAMGSLEGLRCPYCLSDNIRLDPKVVVDAKTLVVERTCYGYGPVPRNGSS